jgi:drug/metabolite transporter (DMT)-like permease
MAVAGRPAAARGKVILAFAAVYVIWGSSFLGIRFAIESLPPFLMAALRFGLAGVTLTIASLLLGATRPTRRELRSTALIGALTLFLGNGAVVFAEQFSASGRVALLVTMTPIWFVVLEWLRPGGHRPRAMVVVGLALGLVGVVILFGPEAIAPTDRRAVIGELIVMGGSLTWASGSMYSRHAPLPRSSALASGLQMAFGSLCFLGVAAGRGEFATFHVASVTPRSWIALAYLATCGSIVGYSAYVWLLQVSTPARVGTYAYVNPIVAVFLGWAFAGEAVTLRMLFAAAVIVAGVAMITAARSTPPPAAGEDEAEHA